MSMRIHFLLAISIVVVVGALGVVAYLATHSDSRVSVVAETSAEGQGMAATTPAEESSNESAVKADSLPRRTALANAPAVRQPQGSPPETPETEADRASPEKRDSVTEERTKQICEELVRDLKLTEEQAKLAERALTDLEGVARSLAVLLKDIEVMRNDLRRQAEENQWTPEQVKEIRQRVKQEFSVVRRDEVLQLIENGVQALDGLRPVLTPEQVPALEHKLRDAEKAKQRVLQGDFP